MISRIPLFDLTGAAIVMSIFVALFFAETFSALRRRVEPRLRRALINAAVAAPALLVLRLLLIPTVVATARWAGEHSFGLVHWLSAPPVVGMIGSFLLLDYAMYGWHWMNHHVPSLWRFHQVHHSDLDLDVTTALRFHFGEMLLSVAIRAFEVLLIGAEPSVVLIYEICLEASTQFHHSNLRLPLALERVLSCFIMTPRAHGIHHSMVDRETNSNYSNLLSCWDRLHRTTCLNVPQASLVIGLPTHRDPAELSVLPVLAMPFQKPRRPRPEPEKTTEPLLTKSQNEARGRLLP